MTSLRFVGDVPLWLGLTLAVVVAVLSWLYYRRESFELPGNLRILLPLLRSTAFLLGILILTGPVLHHRKTIGELGRVKIFLDVSQSMSQNDKHMSIGRKLKIARQIGWVSGELPMTTEFEALEQVILARKKLNQNHLGSKKVPKLFMNHWKK